MPKRLRSCLLMLLLLILSTPAFAQNTSPQGVLVARSKFFSIFGPPDLDVLTVLDKIDFDYFLQVDTLLGKKREDPRAILGDTVDAIFLESSRILGINVYSFEATMEFLPDESTVKIVVKQLTGVDIEERAFYLHEVKTIYVSVADLTVGVLGHEMAHAIISHYFGAPPAERIQEILSGYVDYSLQKSTRNLSR